MKNTKLQELALRIEESNEAFKKMSKAEKRVEIAKDCIERIKIGQLEAGTGTMFNLSWGSNWEDKDESLKDILNNDEEGRCTVCAKGGLFMSVIGRTNDFKGCELLGENNIRGKEHQKLLKFFSAEQLTLIETAFEGSDYLHLNDDEKALEKAEKFYEKYAGYSNASKRLNLICKNIIKNKGTFKP